MNGRRDGPLMRGGSAGSHTSTLSRKSRIAVAVAVGVLIGLVCAFLYPDGLLHSSSNPPDRELASTTQAESDGCISHSDVEKFKFNISLLRKNNAEIRKMIEELSLSVQRAGYGQSQPQLKAGPFGTLKALRTNPVIIPDESVKPRLARILEKVALNHELIVALANSNVQDMLELWFASIKRVGITNYLVVALDDNIETFCKSNGVPVYKRDPDDGVDSVGRTGGNHQVSALKFRILREFLQLGYAVLLSDVDIVFLQNPFNHLYRDSDVESMSDGHNNATAYGYNDVSDEPSMGWARYAHTMRIWVFNSGFFYIRPTAASVELLDRVADRLAQVKDTWDQAVFNEELFFPSHPGYDGLHASRRAMDMFLFMNSKVLFTTVRKDRALRKLKPAIVHVNYHPDKTERMKAVIKFYVNNDGKLLDALPDGSE